MKKKNRKKGFTLIELIVVMAIIAILASIAVPVTLRYVDKARESSDDVILKAVFDQSLASLVSFDLDTVTSDEIANDVNSYMASDFPYNVVGLKDLSTPPEFPDDNKKDDDKIIGVYVKKEVDSDKLTVYVNLYKKDQEEAILSKHQSV